MKILLLLNLVFFLFGTYKIGKKITGDLGFWLGDALVGYLPLYALQAFYGYLNWTNPQFNLPQQLILFFAKSVYSCVGIIVLTRFLKRHSFTEQRKTLVDFVKKNKTKAYFTFFVILCFLPFLLRLMAVSGTSDSDAFTFWLQRAYSLSKHGIIWPILTNVQQQYSALLPSFLGTAIGNFQSGVVFYFLYRALSLVFLIQIFGVFYSSFKSDVIAFALISIFLVANPIKWLNGYQDQWLGLFVVLFFANTAHIKRCLWICVILIALKNEGIPHALLLIGYLCVTHWPQVMDFLKRQTSSLFVVAFFSLLSLSWKIFSKLLQIGAEDIQVQIPATGELFHRMYFLISKYFVQAARAPHLLMLPAFLCFIYMMKKILVAKNRESRNLCFSLLTCFLIFAAPLAVLVVTNLDFVYHVNTTFIRVTVPGLMALLFVTFEVIDKEVKTAQF